MGFSGEFASRGREPAGRAKRVGYRRVSGARIEEHALRRPLAKLPNEKGRGSLRALSRNTVPFLAFTGP
jgi:hypothetical protein